MVSARTGKFLQRLRAWHKWPSLIFTLFILLFAISGIILNHRSLFSPVDVSRKLLPPVYRYHNWNLAAVKGAVSLGGDSILIYGNIGIWLTDTSLRNFSGFNNGFPEGIDNRKVAALSADPVHGLHAATYFGLYRFHWLERRWQKVPLPVPEERIVKVVAKGDSLLVMTRSSLLVATREGGPDNFRRVEVPGAADDDGKVGLFKTLWVIHSGEIYGMAGKLIVDAIGVGFIILCITGLIFFFIPNRLNGKTNDKWKLRLKRFRRNSLRWHNSIGSWAILILILTTLTGVFLRPPLLIPIAGTRVEKIRFSELDSPNPWFDRFRDLLYDRQERRWLVATSEGIYEADESFSSWLKPFPVQPPLSVMGINVFEQADSLHFLVGSFSGLFLWEPGSGSVVDYFTKMPYRNKGEEAPFGELSVAGYVQLAVGSWQLAVGSGQLAVGSWQLAVGSRQLAVGSGQLAVGSGQVAGGRTQSSLPDSGSRIIREVLFDYMGGAISLAGGKWFPEMPEEVKEASPISLWNAALEIHTGRIFQPILGDFYILVVPLVGLFTLEISVVGFLAWWVVRRKKHRAMKPDSAVPETERRKGRLNQSVS